MAQITISLPEELADQVRYYAERNGYATVSDFIREVLRDRISDPRKMTFWDRALMVRMLQMYAKIMNDTGLDTQIEAFRSGYTREYTRHFQDIDPKELAPEVVQFVLDVFDCYEDLQDTADSLNDEALTKQVRFPGYDGNNESEYLGYAAFLVKTERYAYIKRTGSGFNSHVPTLPTYRRMLQKWNDIRATKPDRSDPLSRADVDAIVAARKYPGS